MSNEGHGKYVPFSEAVTGHLERCFQPEKMSCPVSKTEDHRWSGWPGAFCLDCGVEDKDELCVGNACACLCHQKFWEEYSNFARGL